MLASVRCITAFKAKNTAPYIVTGESKSNCSIVVEPDFNLIQPRITRIELYGAIIVTVRSKSGCLLVSVIELPPVTE